MKRYVVTPLAGPFVAGRRNPGAGESLYLTDRQAAHELRLGTIARPEPAKRSRRKAETESDDA